MLECEPPTSTLPTETSEEDERTRATRASIIVDSGRNPVESDDALQRELLAATRSPSLQLRHDWVNSSPLLELESSINQCLGNSVKGWSGKG